MQATALQALCRHANALSLGLWPAKDGCQWLLPMSAAESSSTVSPAPGPVPPQVAVVLAGQVRPSLERRRRTLCLRGRPTVVVCRQQHAGGPRGTVRALRQEGMGLPGEWGATPAGLCWPCSTQTCLLFPTTHPTPHARKCACGGSPAHTTTTATLQPTCNVLNGATVAHHNAPAGRSSCQLKHFANLES